MLTCKSYLKKLCRYLYIVGIGECWYEESHRSNLTKKMYIIWVLISHAYMVVGMANEILANFRPDLSPKEQNEAVQAFFAHPLIYGKVVVVYYERNRIKEAFRSLFEDNKAKFFSKEIDKAAVKKAVLYSLLYCCNVYTTFVVSIADAVNNHYKTGFPIQIETLMYPASHHSGTFVSTLRVIFTFHWLFMVTVMCINDSICFSTLIILESKYKLLQLYFLTLRENFLQEGKSKSEKELEYLRDFRVGMLMMEDTLWCVRRVKSTIGKVNSIQILQSISLLVILLIKLVGSDRNLAAVTHITMFIASVTVLTGVYMTTSGDITYEAGRLPTCIFHSGWDLNRPSPRLRCLLVAALLRSQTPVNFTAFHIVNLSYTSFISVLRFSYSFFAVMY